MDIYCGLDSGGTKTRCVLADEGGRMLGIGESGPSNYLFCSKEKASHSIKESIQKAFYYANREPVSLKCSYIASAAIEVNNGASHIPFISTCVDTQLIHANSDAVPVWFAVARKNPAIVTISGTGSVTYAFWEDNFIKSGGWGALFGDEGSGYDIGRRAINASSRVQDGRENHTCILEAIYRHFKIADIRELHYILRNGDQRSIVASAAICVIELYKKGNVLAAEILKTASKELFLAIQTVLDRAGFEKDVPLILSGGLLKDELPLNHMLHQMLQEEKSISKIVTPQVPIAASAAAMALYENGKRSSSELLLEESKGKEQ